MKINFSTLKLKLKFNYKFKYKKHLFHAARISFWFFTGAFLAIIFIGGFSFIAYQNIYKDKVYPGVYIGSVNFGGKSQNEVRNYFQQKNDSVGKTKFEFTSDYGTATISAKDINFGYDTNLAAQQAYSIGRSQNIFSNLSLMLQAFLGGIHLPVQYSYDENKVSNSLSPISQKIYKEPVDALFKFENNRVIAFRLSEDGQTIDLQSLNNEISQRTLSVMTGANDRTLIIPIPIKILKPKISTNDANGYGIKELIGSGSSLFYGSAESRIYNINLAAKRLNGILVAPGEVFSFDQALGDVSSFTGYKQAYVIQNGRTVLGDGGGVCQVSTTFFRAILNAGLPVVERHAHAYRVGYYEEDSPPGFDATIYVPTVDLKFKNDTQNYILIESFANLNKDSLVFNLYGTSDGRTVKISAPVITNQTPAPPPLYQDDPNLPKGQTQQTDFAAPGADVYFTRTVTKDNKIIISDKFVSDYQPWRAVYLVGTK